MWKEVPTVAGEAFDPETATHKSLALKLQKRIANLPSAIDKSFGRSYGTHNAVAYFKRYDDGWRLITIQ